MTKHEREDAFRAMLESFKGHPVARNLDGEAAKRLAWDIVDGKRTLDTVQFGAARIVPEGATDGGWESLG